MIFVCTFISTEKDKLREKSKEKIHTRVLKIQGHLQERLKKETFVGPRQRKLLFVPRPSTRAKRAVDAGVRARHPSSDKQRILHCIKHCANTIQQHSERLRQNLIEAV